MGSNYFYFYTVDYKFNQENESLFCCYLLPSSRMELNWLLVKLFLSKLSFKLLSTNYYNIMSKSKYISRNE